MSDSDEIEMTEVAPPKKVVTSKHFAAEAGAAGAAAPPKRKPAKKVVESEEESDGSDYEGEASESEEKPKVKKAAKAAPAPKKAKTEGADASPLKKVEAKLTNKEKAALEKKQELEGFPVALRVSGVCTESEYFARRAFWEAKKGGELKELLKHNSQLHSGSKTELAVRCAEFELLGGLPKCPHCKTGSILKVDTRATAAAGQQVYQCKGRQGGEEGTSDAYIPCGFSIWAKDFARLPWVDSLDQPPPQQPPPPAAAAGAAAAEPIPELDASEAGDLRAALARVMEQVAKEGLAVPKDVSALKAEIAGLITAHKDVATGAFDLKAVMAKLGMKYAKAAKGMSALVGANDALANAFDAIAAEADDAFKRNTFKLCAGAIRTWPTAIKKGTELSAGPKKVKGIGASCAKLIDGFIKDGKFPPKE